MRDHTKFAIYVAQKRYIDPKMGDTLRFHRFLMLVDETNNSLTEQRSQKLFQARQELHYLWDKASGQLVAETISHLRRAQTTTMIGAVVKGEGRVLLGFWNTALQTGVALNNHGILFDDYKKMADPSQSNNCNAGLKASFDAIGHHVNLGHAGSFRKDLFSLVRDQVQAPRTNLTLENQKRIGRTLSTQLKTFAPVSLRPTG